VAGFVGKNPVTTAGRLVLEAVDAMNPQSADMLGLVQPEEAA